MVLLNICKSQSVSSSKLVHLLIWPSVLCWKTSGDGFLETLECRSQMLLFSPLLWLTWSALKSTQCFPLTSRSFNWAASGNSLTLQEITLLFWETLHWITLGSIAFCVTSAFLFLHVEAMDWVKDRLPLNFPYLLQLQLKLFWHTLLHSTFKSENRR